MTGEGPESVALPPLDTPVKDPLDTQIAGDALVALAESGHPQLAAQIVGLVQVIADEATRSRRFARALSKALEEPNLSGGKSDPTVARRSNRRKPGPFDPFTIFAEGGGQGLHDRLAELDLEQLRDIVADHGMDHDRLAMKWKDPTRVIARIVERVAARASKGSAFRGREKEIPEASSN